MLERALGFEQGRDIDFVSNPEQSGEVQRGQHGAGLFAFGHQHPDRAVGIDVVQDLRDRQKLAYRSAVLDRQGREVGTQRLPDTAVAPEDFALPPLGHEPSVELYAQLKPIADFHAPDKAKDKKVSKPKPPAEA